MISATDSGMTLAAVIGFDTMVVAPAHAEAFDLVILNSRVIDPQNGL
jgi:hypothetical protein